MGLKRILGSKGIKGALDDLFQKKLGELRDFRLRKTLEGRYKAFGKNPSMENFCDLVEKLVENNRHEEAQALTEAMLEIGIQKPKGLSR
jgi:hypothetical protein